MINLLFPNHHKEFDLGCREEVVKDHMGVAFKLNCKAYFISLAIE